MGGGVGWLSLSLQEPATFTKRTVKELIRDTLVPNKEAGKYLIDNKKDNL
jgi:hypothetical protein